MNYLRLVTLKNSKSLLAASLLTIAASFVSPQMAWAQEDESPSFFKDRLGASGSLRAAAWNRDKSYTDTRGFGVGSAWLTLRPEEVWGVKLYADGFVQIQDATREDFSRVDLRELYIEKSFGDFDFKIGRAITVWGRADKVNPTDNLSVRNYKLLMTDDEDQRTGVFSTQMVYNWGSTRLIGIWIPEWRSPVYPIPPLAGILLADRKPDDVQEQFAFKIDRSGGSVDWSLSYFHGPNKLPDLQLVSAGPGGTVIGFDYGDIQVFGADVAFTWGEYGFRGEIAGTLTEDSSGQDPLVQNSQLYAVIGADRTVIENFNINAQVLYKHIFDHQELDSIANPAVKVIAQQIALNSNQDSENILGVSLRPSYKMYNETLELEVAFVSWFHNHNSLIRPKITYAFNDHFKGMLGGEFYSGPQDSFFGRLQPTSSGFAELRWNF